MCCQIYCVPFGCVPFSSSFHTKLMYACLPSALGGVPSPFDCYLCNRGLKTLHLRMEQHFKNAMAAAKFLERDPRVERVIFPGACTITVWILLQRVEGLLFLWLTVHNNITGCGYGRSPDNMATYHTCFVISGLSIFSRVPPFHCIQHRKVYLLHTVLTSFVH